MARSTRRLALTHEGKTLLTDARRIVAEWDAAVHGLRQGNELSGPIRVTATNDFGRSQLRPLLDAFQLRNPRVQISLLLNDSTVDLIDDHIDVALRYGPLQDSSMQARLLVPGKRLVCAAPSYWDRMGRPTHPNELAQHNCLVLARPRAPLASWSFREDERLFSLEVAADRQASNGAVLREWAVLGVAWSSRSFRPLRMSCMRITTVLARHLNRCAAPLTPRGGGTASFEVHGHQLGLGRQ